MILGLNKGDKLLKWPSEDFFVGRNRPLFSFACQNAKPTALVQVECVPLLVLMNQQY